MSFYQNYISSLLPSPGKRSWIPNDTEELFKQQEEAARKLGWTEHSITYNIDEYGFRNNSIPNKSDTYDLFLGCSFTFGIGVNKSWVDFVQQHTGNPSYNAGRPGGGIDTCYRHLVFLLKQGYKFDNVFMLSPDPGRVEFWDRTEEKWMTVAWWTHYKRSIIKAFTDEYYTRYNYEKSIDAIKGICYEKELTLHHFPHFEFDELINNDEKGRDLQHPSEAAHYQIAKNFIKLYDNHKIRAGK